MSTPLSHKTNTLSVFILLFTSSIIITTTFGDCFDSIISFGDSYADTGSSVYYSEGSSLPPSAFPPYGQTFFGQPTGRYSDGRLVIDFFADHFRLPLVLPYFEPNGTTKDKFGEGVNYAFGGATALNYTYLFDKGIKNPNNNISLSTQFGWFKDMLASSCPDTSSDECKTILQKSLFLLGEIGGNDAIYTVVGGKILDIMSILSDVVDTISSALKDLIELGAVNIMVPGQVPFGCVPALLTAVDGLSPDLYDPSTGCFILFNNAAEKFNEDLQKELVEIQKNYSHTNIIYADNYNALMPMYKSPEEYGIKNTLDACCGGGGPNNVNLSVFCGDDNATVCDDTASYVSWDGVHMTEKAYSIIANSVLEMNSNIVCPSPIPESQNVVADT